MFGKLRDKLKGWLKRSKEKVEETAPKEEIKEVEKEEKEVKTEKEEKPETKEEIVEEEIKELKEEKEIEKPKIKPEEAGTAIAIEKEIEEDITEEELEEIKEADKEKIEEVESGDEKEAEPKKKSFLGRIKSKFSYTITENEFNSIFNDLEMLLLENNVALEVVEDIKTKLSEKLIDKEIRKEDLESEIKKELKKTLNEILIDPDDPLDIIKYKKKEQKEPFVILFFGINGTGKTTTIAKLANLFKKNNLSVVLAAGDTFRAASIEQIEIHANELNIPLIKHDYGSDPSAVGFDADSMQSNMQKNIGQMLF